jgi:hypothetical protein
VVSSFWLFRAKPETSNHKPFFALLPLKRRQHFAAKVAKTESICLRLKLTLRVPKFPETIQKIKPFDASVGGSRCAESESRRV